MNSPRIVFSTAAYTDFTSKICQLSNLEYCNFHRESFPDGERYYRLTHCVEGVDAVLVGGTISDLDTLELYDLAWALCNAGVRSLTLIVPYFAYSTMERMVKPGEVVMAKSRAHLFSSLPEASNGNRIVLLDLHAEGIPYYFGVHVRPVHLYAKQIVMDAARSYGDSNFVLASTDAGRAKWVESLANDLQVEAAFVYKQRLDGLQTKVTGISANVRDKLVIIYDDMIRTGSSLMQAAKAYRAAGASDIIAITTHGLFPADSLAAIRQSRLLRKIVCTDSHPRATSLACDFLEVRTVTGLFSDYLQLGDQCPAACKQAGHGRHALT